MQHQNTESVHVRVRIAHATEIARVAAAYTEWGYGGGIASEDTAWLAEASDNLVGILRVAPEHGTLVLRGMQVAEQWRRAGIGTQCCKPLHFGLAVAVVTASPAPI
jgi:GNAT superfamily N-acetyltransferase